MNEEECYLFDLRGYLVVENALSHEEVRELNAIIDAMPSWQEQSGSKHIHTGFSEEAILNGNPDPNSGPVDFYSGLLLDWGEPFRRLVGHHSILPYLTELIGPTCRLDHQYAIFMAQGGVFAGGHALHGGGTPFDPTQYYHFRDNRFYNGLTVFSFALTDAPAGEGGFCCIPGSHKSNLQLPEHYRDLETPASCIVQVPVKAGDVLIFTEALSHGCLRWTAEHERRALLYKYCPGHMQWEPGSPFTSPHYDWSPLQRRILERPYFNDRQLVIQDAE